MGAEAVWASLLERFEDEAGDPFEGDDAWEQELMVKLAVSVGVKKNELVRFAKERDLKDAFLQCWRAKLCREEAAECLIQARKATSDGHFQRAKELYEQVLVDSSHRTPCVLLDYVTHCRILNADCVEQALITAASTNDDEVSKK
eukprot:GEMP01088887.1.p1 GENE.GEMP01088887.1~~GEMP01088887.1.p1  ORF type:complete len:145 (+),score=34.08 GEMP01088887.1:87-521(+)